VIGTFTTTRFDSRRDFDERRSSGAYVCRNHFTEIGVRWMWEMMTGRLRSSDGTLNDHLGSARLVVGNGDLAYAPEQSRLTGDQTAQADMDNGFPLTSVEMTDVGEDLRLPVGRITLRAVFDENTGNFEWREQGVVTAQGVLIDRAVGDAGRKPLGAVWETQAVLELSG
jgi:hypothetical protein